MTRDEEIREIINLAIGGIDAFNMFNKTPIYEDFEAIKQTLKPALALLKEQPCKTCGGSGEVGTELYKVGFDSLGERTIPCPDCPEKK